MNKDQNGRIVYADIYNLPHFQSKTRPHMSLYGIVFDHQFNYRSLRIG